MLPPPRAASSPSQWYLGLPAPLQEALRELVAAKKFSFANGGWCMHDEATTHFLGMIDQTTLGHRFLKEHLGVVPSVGWQIDPFGHSATQAGPLTAGTGFDALYFGRIHYADLEARHAAAACEGLWASKEGGTGEQPVFWGLTGSFSGNYGASSRERMQRRSSAAWRRGGGGEAAGEVLHAQR